MILYDGTNKLKHIKKHYGQGFKYTVTDLLENV